MADEATPQETTESVEDVTDNTDTDIDPTEDPGTDVQGAEADVETPAEDKAPAEKTYGETYVKKLRAEAANLRVNGKKEAEKAALEAAAAAEKALTEKWAKALGLAAEDAEPDPAELLKQAEQQAQEAARERDAFAERLRDYARKDAITTAANAKDVSGDLEAILDSRKISREVEKLDTEADDFPAQVAAIVKEAVESNPKLKKVAQVAPSRSGGDLSGGNADRRSTGTSVDDFRDQITKDSRR